MSNITKQGNLITTEIYETDAVVEDENLLKYAINDNIKIRIINTHRVYFCRLFYYVERSVKCEVTF